MKNLNLKNLAVLVLDPEGDAVLYARPRADRSSDEFFRDRQYGELWAGRRPSLEEISASIGIRTRDLREFESDAASWGTTRIHAGIDAPSVTKPAGTAYASPR